MPPSSPSSAPPSTETEATEDGFTPPNTNIQYCSLVKTSLGSFRTILGGEVDCLTPRPGLEEGNPHRVEVKTRDFVELKTNIVIGGERDVRGFERFVLFCMGRKEGGKRATDLTDNLPLPARSSRNKLLKHYVQSCTFSFLSFFPSLEALSSSFSC